MKLNFKKLVLAITLALVATSSIAAGLDLAESTHLKFMRSEEKLARDVYTTFNQKYGRQVKVFGNIAKSEQTHTNTVLSQLTKYRASDPEPGANNMPAMLGIFTNPDYREYFNAEYSMLVNKGTNLLEALKVGALIEELDMHDIVKCPSIILEKSSEITACGMAYTDEPALKRMYSNLLEGSKNHLRAFTSQITKITGKPYTAQYLSQTEVDQLLKY